MPGYDVAAKTSTAGMYTYYSDHTLNHITNTLASTVAYGPTGERDPMRRFVVLIELKDSEVQWGSETAAPGVSELLRQLFQHYGPRPDPKHIQPDRRCAGPDNP
ncbi:MAG: hypothetical protein ACRDIE_18395 [Chloroflexota bacterium]